MYNYAERLALMKALGVVGVVVCTTTNERPGPGQKLVCGSELEVQNEQGFLGSFDPKLKLTFNLMVEVKRQDDLFVAWTEGRDRQIKLLGDQTASTVETALYAKRIATDRAMTIPGEPYITKPDYPGNSSWVISTANGRLQMWEVAIVTIIVGGLAKYYLSLQKVYAAEMFLSLAAEVAAGADDVWPEPIFVNEKDFPGYEKWQSLRDFLCENVEPSTLRLVSGGRSAETSEPIALGVNKAEVIWFNQARGFGFARINGRDVNPIFHRSSVLGQEFVSFEAGEVIEYLFLKPTPRGAQLIGVS